MEEELTAPDGNYRPGKAPPEVCSDWPDVCIAYRYYNTTNTKQLDTQEWFEYFCKEKNKGQQEEEIEKDQKNKEELAMRFQLVLQEFEMYGLVIRGRGRTGRLRLNKVEV